MKHDFSNNNEYQDCDEFIFRQSDWLRREYDSDGLKGTVYVNSATFRFEMDRGCFAKLSSKTKFEGMMSFDENERLEVHFNNCHFKKGLSLRNDHDFQTDLRFENCELNRLDLSESHVKSKVRARKCTLHNVELENTTFKDLIDFWNCEFLNTTVLHKTDFYGTTVFAASKFNENILFTYSLIDKTLILRGSRFENGLDLSLAIGQGKINCFDIKVKDFDSQSIESIARDEYEETYDRWVCTDVIIPHKNKRETFRILKHTLVSQNNVAESIPFMTLEKKTLSTELKVKRFRAKEDQEKWYLWKKGLLLPWEEMDMIAQME